MNPVKSATKKSASSRKAKKGLLSDVELAAMKETLKERKAAGNKAEEERAALDAIAAMQEPDRSMAKRIHAIIKEMRQPSPRRPGTGCPPMPTMKAR